MPRSWLVYGLLGAAFGGLSGALAGAIGTGGPPDWRSNGARASGGLVTVGLQTRQLRSAAIAELIMLRHGPTQFSRSRVDGIDWAAGRDVVPEVPKPERRIGRGPGRLKSRPGPRSPAAAYGGVAAER